MVANHRQPQGNRQFIAPGEEIVSAVFRDLGTEYDKSTDAQRIATVMNADEIAPEIRDLLARAVALAHR